MPLAIFRIAGIYGPGRNAFVNLAEGKAHRIVKPGQVFNRIHVDDIAATLAAAVARNAAGIFNLADDEPAPPQDVVAFAAGLMGVAAAAGGPVRRGRPLADGALVLRREQARREPAHQAGARRRRSAIRPTARGWPRCGGTGTGGVSGQSPDLVQAATSVTINRRVAASPPSTRRRSCDCRIASRW